jgi:hypothetical protein
MRFFLFAIALAVAVLGCSDGKLNLLIVFWGDSEEPSSSSREREEPKSSSSVVILSSSSIISSSSADVLSSSSEEELPSSSSKEISSSSLTPSSSSSSGSRGTRSSSSKGYEDYPALEEGASGVQKGWASRYWDGCKPSCSWYENIYDFENNKYLIPPWANSWTICRNCDVKNNEMPTWFEHPSTDQWWQGYLGTASGCDPNNMDYWVRSSTYQKWQADNPTYPLSPAYTCWDMAPHIINDTLAYAFAATSAEKKQCGHCFLLQFDGGNHFGIPRDTHTAIKGKNLVVMSSNIGPDVEKNQFDIMIPAGGLGAHDGFSTQIGVAANDLGTNPGGLLSTCIYSTDYYKTNREWLQNCVIEKCNKVFGNKAKELLDGCLFMADWYMAADNPTLVYKEVPCPQYLIDKYKSKIDLEPPPKIW